MTNAAVSTRAATSAIGAESQMPVVPMSADKMSTNALSQISTRKSDDPGDKVVARCGEQDRPKEVEADEDEGDDMLHPEK